MLHLILAAVLAASDAAPEWPKKGDTVYVSADLVSIQGTWSILFGGPPPEAPVPACVPLTIYRAKPKKVTWTTQDPAKNILVLEGAWLPRMHTTSEECEKCLAEKGQPKIVRKYAKHVIVTPPAMTDSLTPQPPKPDR